MLAETYSTLPSLHYCIVMDKLQRIKCNSYLSIDYISFTSFPSFLLHRLTATCRLEPSSPFGRRLEGAACRGRKEKVFETSSLWRTWNRSLCGVHMKIFPLGWSLYECVIRSSPHTPFLIYTASPLDFLHYFFSLLILCVSTLLLLLLLHLLHVHHHLLHLLLPPPPPPPPPPLLFLLYFNLPNHIVHSAPPGEYSTIPWYFHLLYPPDN